MKNHFPWIYFIFAFFFGQYLFADPNCKLLFSDPKQMKYDFICDREKINIECSIKDEIDCEIEILNALVSKKIRLSGDKLRELGVFKKDDQLKVDCEAKFKICSYTTDSCLSYKNSFQTMLEGQIESVEGNSDRCDPLGLLALRKAGNLSLELLSGNSFSKKDCSDNAGSGLQTLQFKLDIFRANLSLPISSTDNFLNKCLNLNDEGKKAKILAEEFHELEKLRNLAFERTKSLESLKELVCNSGLSSLYEQNGTLSMDTLMCMVMEDAKVSVQSRSYSFSCPEPNSNVPIDDEMKRFASNQAAVSAAQNQPPVSNQPMPQILETAAEQPVGLKPALANIDSIAPNGFSSGGAGTESVIGSGAVRSSGAAPDIAARAGQMIAPVVSRIRDIASAAVSAAPSKRTPSSSAGNLAASSSGIRPVGASPTSKINIPGQNSGSTPTSRKNSEEPELELEMTNTKIADQTGVDGPLTTRTEVAAAQVGGPVRNGGVALVDRTSTSQSGSPVSEPTSQPEVLDNTQLQQRVARLRKPTDIRQFFVQETADYPQFRKLIYDEKDNPVKTFLETCGIKVVSKSNKVSSNKKFKVTSIISDNGSAFIPMKLGECNK